MHHAETLQKTEGRCKTLHCGGGKLNHFMVLRCNDGDNLWRSGSLGFSCFCLVLFQFLVNKEDVHCPSISIHLPGSTFPPVHQWPPLWDTISDIKIESDGSGTNARGPATKRKLGLGEGCTGVAGAGVEPGPSAGCEQYFGRFPLLGCGGHPSSVVW
jgi:hypothetical protein|mmetsp:Transcript_4700/g.8637  ORF Transcript_4700/g.8637 Transcript_4700/m.8637 type:complete len:157 (+) Transcript_4700:441-911(+)